MDNTSTTPEAHPFPPQTPAFYLRLSSYWFSLSLLWGGMITIVMQTRIREIAGDVDKDTYLGYTLAIGALISTLACLVVGTMSDRSRWKMGKRRPYIIVGTLTAIPALFWLPAAMTVPTLILAFCTLQFLVNIATSPSQALVPDMVPREHQGAASAYMGMSSLIGTMGGLVLCGMLIAQRNGLWIIMTVLAVVLLLGMLVTVRCIPERSAADSHVPQLGFLATLVASFRVNPREHPDFFWLIASRFAINIGFYTATEFLEYYVSDTLHAPHPDVTVGYLFLLSTFSGLLGNFPAGILSDRVSKKLVVYVSNGITGVAALIFLLTSSLTVAFCAAFVFGVGYGAFQAVDWALATNLLPQGDDAKFMGLWQAAFTVPQIVAPAIGAVVSHYFNHLMGPGFGYRAVLFLVLVYLAIGSALITPIRERDWSKGKEL